MLGVGLDLVELDRFARALARHPRINERLFTAAERGYAERFADPAPALAARFAAKEAVMKAMGVGLGAFSFPEAEVCRHPSGQPFLALHGKAAELAARLGVQSWLVSLTHSESTAAAVAIAMS